MTQPLNRRDFLQAGAMGAAALAFSRVSAAVDVKDPYLGLKMGLQSYSLREFKVEEALQQTRTLGLKYWEAYPNHVPMGSLPKHIETQKETLAKAGVTLISYGVLPFDTNENAARERFEFAKAMGIKSISADPNPDNATFDLLDKLVAEYDVAIAIHNHGPGHRFLRSDEDPVDAVHRLGARVFGVHLKDVKSLPGGQKQFKIAGEGDLKVTELLKALKGLKYQYLVAVEYEENAKNPLADIDACLRHVRECAAKVS